MRSGIRLEQCILSFGASLLQRFATIVTGACLGTAACLPMTEAASATPVQLIASNSMYADLAAQIGGPNVSAIVLEHGPNREPLIQPGSIVLCGSTRADAWLRDTAQYTSPPAIVVQVPRGRFEESDNVQVPWFDVMAISTFTRALAHELTQRAPSAAPSIAGNLANTEVRLQAVSQRISEVARDYAGSDVIVADDLSRAVARQLGFKAVPLAKSARTAIAEAIQRRKGSIFLYDRDAVDPKIKELVNSATEAGVPVLALQEKLPRGLHYQQWALRQWNAIHGALNEASP
jgi:zinc/manganese transport system substrate-binding protein